MQILTELGREIEDSIGFFPVQHPLGLLHIRRDGDYPDIGRGIHTTGKLAAQIRVGLIHDHHLRLVYHLVIINKGIEQWIGKRDQKKEDQHTLVLEDIFQLVFPDVKGI